MATHSSAYTVNGRLTELTSRVTALEAEVKAMRVHLAGELKTAVENAKHSFRDGRDGVDGKDGQPGATGLQGIQGERGDVLYIGPEEVQAAVATARAALVEQRAKFLAAIAQAEYDARGDSSVHRIIRGRIEQLKRESGLV